MWEFSLVLTWLIISCWKIQLADLVKLPSTSTVASLTETTNVYHLIVGIHSGIKSIHFKALDTNVFI